MLLLFVLISPFPRSKWIISIISAIVSGIVIIEIAVTKLIPQFSPKNISIELAAIYMKIKIRWDFLIKNEVATLEETLEQFKKFIEKCLLFTKVLLYTLIHIGFSALIKYYFIPKFVSFENVTINLINFGVIVMSFAITIFSTAKE